jgi:hypothetical protein
LQPDNNEKRKQAMDNNIKALIAKAWKDEDLDLDPGRHYFDDVVTVRLSGIIEKQADQLVAPTTSVPLITTLALFWEKAGIARDDALNMLREAITEAMSEGTDKNEQIESHIKDVEAAVKAVKDDLIAKLPKARRSGRVVTKGLDVEILPVADEVFLPVAA